ncbi:MAG: siderophore-interacting protein [Chloroflexi bacterium]|nr:siderophore-interacting protein [Chloroflexota bacterium]
MRHYINVSDGRTRRAWAIMKGVVQTQTHDQWAFPLTPRLVSIPGVRPLELEVVDVADLGAHMRRIRLVGKGLEDFAYQPGQDVMLVLSGGERPLSRRYTIRGFDPGSKTLELNIVAHGVRGPGASWASQTQPGDRINGVGPRGKIFIDADPDADWHLFLGDESAAPGSLHMLESLPVGRLGQAYLEVPSAADELPTTADGVTWLYRGDVPAINSTMLVDAMTTLELPEGRGHVYIAGEVQIVSAVLRVALARGLSADQVSPKAYWGRGKANENNGEPGNRPSA